MPFRCYRRGQGALSLRPVPLSFKTSLPPTSSCLHSTVSAYLFPDRFFLTHSPTVYRTTRISKPEYFIYRALITHYCKLDDTLYRHSHDSMRLAASLYLGLLYVLPSFSILAAESRGQRELLTYQHPQDFGQKTFPRLDEITIDELQSLFSDGTLTSEILVNVSHPTLLDPCPVPTEVGVHPAHVGSQLCPSCSR